MRSLLHLCFALVSAIAVLSGQLLGAADEVKPKPLSVTITYGLNGVIRNDDRFLAGETLFVSIFALRYDAPANGICQFTMRYSLIDKDGKTAFTNANDNVNAILENGSIRVKIPIRCALSELIEPGKYDFVLELREKKTKEVFRSSQPITILPKDEFALGDFHFSADSDSTVPLGTTFETCQEVFFCWTAYYLTVKDDQWQVEMDFEIVDANKKAIAPAIGPRRKEIPNAGERIFPIKIPITIEEPGEYAVVFTMTDVLTGKSESRSIPFRVVQSLVDIFPSPAQ